MFRSIMNKWLSVAALIFFALGAVMASAQDGSLQPAATGSIDTIYKLGPGDKVRINLFGQTDFSGDYVVDGTGNVQLPLIGPVKAVGRTVVEFQREVTVKLSDGFFANPSLSIEVINYRPFYIIGEVNKPGEYPYVNGMSILNAVALAGGYTTRADDAEVYIRRSGQNQEVQVPADQTTKVEPGDIIRIPQRYF